jgi:hypothetical protein
MLALLLLGCAVAACLIYPLSGTWLAVALLLYSAALWRYPSLALPAVLALLPLLDFSPWSGWILLNEFDLVLAVTAAVWLIRPPTATVGPRLPPVAKWLIAGVAASFVVSALLGFLPLAPLDANALSGPYTPWSSLRQLKGFIWALALLPMLREEAMEADSLQRRCTLGMVLGLSGVIAVILWQRIAFAGLFDFGEAYRVEGPFPELHTGGGDVHAYLVAAMPFALAWAVQRPSRRRIALASALFVLATYAVGVTFTRGSYIGYAAAFIVMCAALVRDRLPARDRRFGRIGAIAMLSAIGLIVLLPIVSGSFMEARLSGTQAEAMTRTRHWARAIAMMDRDAPTTLFGMGLGSFPKTLLLMHPETASASFGFNREGDHGYLKLGSGRPLYIDQRVAIAAGETYTVSLDLRSSDPNARLDAMLCEKSIQYSFRCQAATLRPGSPGVWEHRDAVLSAGEIGSGSWLFRRPVALSLTNPQKGTVVDVDRVRLLDARGQDRLANGDFSAGGARWFFAADDHLPWHIFNLWVEILFEQGWLGVLVVAGVAILALRNDAVAMWQGDLHAGMLLASMVGFLAVGVTESLFDGPRVTTLFFVLILLSLLPRPMGSGQIPP